MRSRLLWLGCVNDRQPIKILMCGELDEGKHPVGRSKLSHKDTCENAPKCGNMLEQWNSKASKKCGCSDTFPFPGTTNAFPGKVLKFLLQYQQNLGYGSD